MRELITYLRDEFRPYCNNCEYQIMNIVEKFLFFLIFVSFCAWYKTSLLFKKSPVISKNHFFNSGFFLPIFALKWEIVYQKVISYNYFLDSFLSLFFRKWFAEKLHFWKTLLFLVETIHPNFFVAFFKFWLKLQC